MGKLGKALFAFVAFMLCAWPADPTMLEQQGVRGRWEFAVMPPNADTTTFSTYLLQTNTAITNIMEFTSDSTVCDPLNFNNITVANSNINAAGSVKIVFTVREPNPANNFQYVFKGTLKRGDMKTAGHIPTQITGTFQKTAGGCTNGHLGTSTSDGNFSATFFPDLDGSFAGTLDGPNDPSSSGPSSVPATMALTTNIDHSVSGTVSVPSMKNSGGVACFAGPITLTSGTGFGSSYAAGLVVQLLGTDANGTELFINALPQNIDGSPAALGEDNPSDPTPGNGTNNDGTDNDLLSFYGITGGPCGGFGGGASLPFGLRSQMRMPTAASRIRREK